MHNEHSASRRSRFIVLIFSFNHTNTFLFPRPHFRFIEYIFSFHRIYIFTSSDAHIFVIVHAFSFHISWVYIDMWARQIGAYSSLQTVKILRTNYKNVTFTQQNTLLTLRKYATLTVQKYRYYIAKLLFL